MEFISNPDDDERPTVLAATLTVTCVAILIVAARLWVRLGMIHSFGLDDGFMTFATAISIAGQAVLIIQVRHGIGRHTGDIDFSDDYPTAMKMSFVSQPLYLAAICLVKLAGLLLKHHSHKLVYRPTARIEVKSPILPIFVTITMQAFQYESPAAGLQLRHLPIPEPGPDCVQIRVKAVGLCHTDCHLLKGHDAMLVKRPITLGHEVSGVVAKAGANVAEYRPGDRVAVSLLAHPLDLKDQGWAMAIGFGFDGGYAEYTVAPASRVVRIPDGVSFSEAAGATDAMATSYHAVVIEAGVRSGTTVGIIGLGGLGIHGLGFASLSGANVYGVDIVESKFAQARRLGARGCFTSLEEVGGDVVFDVIVDFVGAQETTGSALKHVKKGGKVVVVGLAAEETTISSADLIERSISLVGSFGASESDLNNVLGLLARKEIEPQLEEIPFADIPTGIDALNRGGVHGRLWADPSKLARERLY